MGQLKDIFDQQNKAKRLHAEDNETICQDIFIRFEINGNTYALPILNVKEIAESYIIAPYPETVAGHLGLVSLRGKVLPVIDPKMENNASLMRASEKKLLVLEFSSEDIFCIEVERVRKILIPRAGDSEIPQRGKILNSNGKPVRVLGKSDFKTQGAA